MFSIRSSRSRFAAGSWRGFDRRREDSTSENGNRMVSVTPRLTASGRLLISPFPEPGRQRGHRIAGIHAAALVALLCLAGTTLRAPPTRNDRIVFVEPAAAPPPPPAEKSGPLPEAKPQPPPPPRLLVPRKTKPLPPPVLAPTMPPATVPKGYLGTVDRGKTRVTGDGNGGSASRSPVDAPISAAKVAHPPTVLSRVLPSIRCSPALGASKGLLF